ncbi:MAG: HAMP domain-containing histidine kinase [Candidatus Pacebacteria bacterium]|nr:HAMP domain-containing histidine kinase [Candidatus Paceibacterota bacterium]
MKKFSVEHIRKRISFIGRNPQIIYTIFLIIIIPVSFLLSGQKFLKVAMDNQERLEQDRIGLMQDVFVGFAALFMDDSPLLQEQIEGIKEQNKTIVDLKVLKKIGSEYQIIASLDTQEIGKIDDDSRRNFNYNMALSGDSLIFPTKEYDGRHWHAVRSIVDDSSNTVGIMYTDISLEHIDELFKEKIKSAYYFLMIIVAAIGVLLIRQAKVIDYAVLYKRLKEVDQMKDDFISMAAHELRTPLTIIRGYTEMLGDSKRLTESDRQMTRNIEQSATNLNKLIGDILDVSRLQQGRLSFDLKNIQPGSYIQEVVESLQYTAKEKGLQLTYQKKDAATIKVDVDRLKQVLINIIGNAVKYTPTGSVTVSSYVEKGLLSMRVSDTGIGISAEEQQKLFSRFYRVRSQETEDIRGTGLGLWITKKIVTQMNGTISVESIKGKGTDLIISFRVIKTEE